MLLELLSLAILFVGFIIELKYVIRDIRKQSEEFHISFFSFR